jgi:2-methylisocitrate lyase-like PEP mutase family enzyme
VSSTLVPEEIAMHHTATQYERARTFHALHATGQPLQLANAWDATSARVLAAAGAPAIGTTSFGVALNHGVWDGEQLPLDEALAVATAIIDAVEVPVSVDMEAGRGRSPAEVRQSVAAAIACGAVGINIEDSIPGRQGALFDASEQAERIAAARAAAEASGIPIFVNARCDVYFGADIEPDQRVEEVLLRSKSYQVAGADGLFLPGLLDVPTITALTAQVELPVNIMVGTGAPPLSELVGAGVRRLSQGGEPFLAMAGTLKLLTERYLAGELAPPAEAIGAGVSLLQELVA